MNNIRLTVVFVLCLVFLSPALLSLGIRFLPDTSMPQTGGSVKVYSEKSLNIVLPSVNDNLVGIIVRVKNSLRVNANLKFQLFDQSNWVVAESVVNGLSVLDGSEVRFSFSSPTFKGQTFKGVFSSDATEQEAMEIYLEKSSDNPAYVLLYKPPSRLGLISNIYSGWLKHLLGI